MTRRITGALSALAVLAALASVVALTAQAGTAARPSVTPTVRLHAVDGSGIHGAVSFASRPGGGTSVALIIHGLPANARFDARLHAGRSLERLSASSTPLPSGHASATGSFRAEAGLLSRGHDVRSSTVTDGAHLVIVRADGRDIAYAHVPRG